MSNLWKTKDVPQRGWDCVDVIDLRPDDGGPYAPGNCEMCGNESLRFIHCMEHEDYPEGVEAGCVCAEKMCEAYNGKKQERRLTNRATRRARWLTRQWKCSANGNHYLNIEGCNVGVFPDKFRPGKWRWWLKRGDTFTSCKQSYDTSEAAKLSLFDELTMRAA